MLKILNTLDRRWIFLAMGLAIAVPILVIGLTGKTFPETPTKQAQDAFDTIENLPDGSMVLITFDFDPASAGELTPMATSMVRHCALKNHLIYLCALWPLGTQMAEDAANRVLVADFPQYRYGENWLNLGFQAGNEVVMKQMLGDVKGAFPKDSKGTATSRIPMMQAIGRITDFNAMLNISAGYPGAKEWVLYVAGPNRTGPKPMRMVAGCTGVQTQQLYPYYPTQMDGLLAAIKGAAEYETLVNRKAAQMLRPALEKAIAAAKLDPGLADLPGQLAAWSFVGADKVTDPALKAEVQRVARQLTDPKYMEAQRRMGPQLFAHLLMVLLIILGNVVFFANRRKGGRA